MHLRSSLDGDNTALSEKHSCHLTCYIYKTDTFSLGKNCQSPSCFINASILNIALWLHPIYFISPACITRSNRLTHLPAPYHGQATRDVTVSNMHSDNKSQAKMGPSRLSRAPHIQFLILTLASPAGLFHNVPTPPPTFLPPFGTSLNPRRPPKC